MKSCGQRLSRRRIIENSDAVNDNDERAARQPTNSNKQRRQTDKRNGRERKQLLKPESETQVQEHAVQLGCFTRTRHE